MVPRNDDKRDTMTGERQQLGVDQIHDGLRDPAAEEEIASVEHQVHPLLNGISQDPAEVGQEVRAAPTPLHPWTDGLVETEVGVGKKQQLEAGRRSFHTNLMLGSLQWPAPRSGFGDPLAARDPGASCSLLGVDCLILRQRATRRQTVGRFHAEATVPGPGDVGCLGISSAVV